jgi:hypothetical protein
MRTIATIIALFTACVALVPSPARAVPSFARQTGQQCTACHTTFPQLTPFGRQFKLDGYVMSSGESDLPHIAAMVQGGFTHTNEGQPGGAAPHFGDNDNGALNAASLFYGGIVVPDYAGAFLQGNYDGVERAWSWDNMDVRIVGSTSFDSTDVSFGLTANNNPTVSDLWNSTPAWGFPYSGSGLAPEPSAGTLIQGGFEQQVAGVGGYAMVDNDIYVEVDGYMTLPAGAQRSLGVDPSDEMEIHGVAPYWRLALNREWGNNSVEVGHFGITAATYPGRDQSMGTDRTTDYGFDTQYQYIGDMNTVSVLASFIIEDANLSASQALGMADNANDMLYSANISTSYLYDQTYGLTLGFFDTFGDTDAARYGTLNGSPDSNGYIIQLDWLPFSKTGGPSFWPYSNIKFSLQYTGYFMFDGATHNYDGTGRDASDNNTLYLQAWLAL